MNQIKSYRDLRVWQDGIKLVEVVYLLTNKFPMQESYRLSDQMRRSVISIPSNIAEGFLRHSTKEMIRFLYIALGSCGELDTQIEISRRLKYMEAAEFEKIEDEIDHISRMIRNMIKGLYSQRTTHQDTNHEARSTNH